MYKMEFYKAYPQAKEWSPNRLNRRVGETLDLLQLTPERHKIRPELGTIGQALEKKTLVIEATDKSQNAEKPCVSCTRNSDDEGNFRTLVLGQLEQLQSSNKLVLDQLEQHQRRIEGLELLFGYTKPTVLRALADDKLRRAGFKGKRFDDFIRACNLPDEEKDVIKKLKSMPANAATHEVPFFVVAEAIVTEEKSGNADAAVMRKWFEAAAKITVEDAIKQQLGCKASGDELREVSCWSDFRVRRKK